MKNNDLIARKIAWGIFKTALKTGQQIDGIIADYLQKSNLKENERRFVTELVNGTVRSTRKLDWKLAQLYSGKYNKIQNNLKFLLRMGAYQIDSMNSVPDYAAVSTSVNLAKQINAGASKLANAVLRAYSQTTFPEPDDQSDLSTWAAWLSHPDWLLKKWTKHWSFDKAKKLAEWNNRTPKIWFKINTLNATADAIKQYLEQQTIKFELFPDDENYFTVNETLKLLQSEFFQSGAIYVQDPAAGLVVELLQPKEGEFVIDGCSAPGGKTAHIAQLMGNKGRILALDSDLNRLQKLSETVSRLKIETVNAEVKDLTSDPIPKTKKLLLDVPCSGTGVMAKRSDLRWRRTKESFREFADLQIRILNNSARFLKRNGVLVYSTCTLEIEENWLIIREFLLNNTDFVIEQADEFIPTKFVDEAGALSTFPPEHSIDGVFAVRLRNLC